MSYLEQFKKAQDVLEIMYPQHKMGVKFSVERLQEMRAAMANMNMAVEHLEPNYKNNAQIYSGWVFDIEQANKNNPDRGAYLKGDISPYKKKLITQKLTNLMPPPERGIFKRTHQPAVTQKKALYAYQQHLAQQRQMNVLAGSFENMTISKTGNNNNAGEISNGFSKLSIKQ